MRPSRWLLLLLTLLLIPFARANTTAEPLIFENRFLRYEIGGDGRNVRFVDLRDGTDYLSDSWRRPFAYFKKDGKSYRADRARLDGDQLRVGFGETDFEMVLRVSNTDVALFFEVLEISDDDLQELTFLDVRLDLAGTRDDRFAACALAMNITTQVRELPGFSTRVRAMAYPRFGLVGARVAMIGAPPGELRAALQASLDHATLERSMLGGPWAANHAANYDSYLIAIGGPGEANVDEWIELAREMGLTQIDFHVGKTLRSGDLEPNPELFPHGMKGVRDVIDRIHAAGMLAGLHTYSFFMDKQSEWVTPVPSPGLAADPYSSLAVSIDVEDDALELVAGPKPLSPVSKETLRIEDELIVCGKSVGKSGPAGCQRGAHGTRAVPHAAGSSVHRLREQFGMFLPHGDSELLGEVARRASDRFNELGFDMIYLDGLDGKGLLAGAENGWYYGARFVHDVHAGLARPALMDMSSLTHHMWTVRSRAGAWDHANRGHKRFVDLHLERNRLVDATLLPAQLGWWTMKLPGSGGEPTFLDDLEYVAGKALGHGYGLSVVGVEPEDLESPMVRELSRRLGDYESLRRAGYFDETVKARLREPRSEFRLTHIADDRWSLRRATYLRRSAEETRSWIVTNPHERQPVRLRFELLAGVGTGRSLTLPTFGDPKQWSRRRTAENVAMNLVPVEVPPGQGPSGLALTATNTGPESRGAWCGATLALAGNLDLPARGALGLWVHGDGKGALLNVQLAETPSPHSSLEDHYVRVDFRGWRYIRLVEPEGEAYADLTWPYGNRFTIYRRTLRRDRVSTLRLWLNEIPAGETVRVGVSPLEHVAVGRGALTELTLQAGGTRATLPVRLEQGDVLDCFDTCRLFRADGKRVESVQPSGSLPTLKRGRNRLRIGWNEAGEFPVRGRATLLLVGEELGQPHVDSRSP